MKAIIFIIFLTISCVNKEGEVKLPSGENADIKLANCLKEESETFSPQSYAEVAQAAYEITINCRTSIESIIPYLELAIQNDFNMEDFR